MKRFMCYITRLCYRHTRTDLGPRGQKLGWNQSVPWRAPRNKKIRVLTRFYNLSSRPAAATDHYSLGPFQVRGCFLSPTPPPTPNLSTSDLEIHSNTRPSSGLRFHSNGALIMLKIYLPLYCLSASLGALSLRAEVGTGCLMTLHFVQAFSFFMDDILLSCQYGEQVKGLPFLQG